MSWTVIILFISELSKSQSCPCASHLLGNGNCDDNCNNEICSYDNGDCKSASSSSSELSDTTKTAIIALCVLAGIVIALTFCFYICWKRNSRWINNIRIRLNRERNESIGVTEVPQLETTNLTLTKYEINTQIGSDYFPTKQEIKGEPLCTICLLEFQIGDSIRVTKCGHGFHLSCLDAWLLSADRKKCPNCGDLLINRNKY
ncbi:unnamed protein product [Blepharisma stoltei]|uniref:RING-type domain-containing protein n=1 Tax=Blepharisma stoltei TaxID=1481888 RepID=A0AAU9K2J1_9CILI|nr:unnamed protein product [Blepharisma stoltei]